MVELRRSSRQRAKPKKQDEYEDEDGLEDEESGGSVSEAKDSFEEEEEDEEESEASEEEWFPPKKHQRTKNGNKHLKLDEFSEESSNDDEEFGGRAKEGRRNGKRSRKDDRVEIQKARPKIVLKPKSVEEVTLASKRQGVSQIADVEEEAEADNDEDEESTRQEAQRLWQEVRSRKAAEKENEGNAKKNKSIKNKAPGGLDQWLGIDPPAWPSTCAEAMINDRDSLFVGFVYTLTSPSQAYITQCLSHLTKVVQPQSVPTDRFPPAMQHLPTNRRGATHDMYAWRALTLKRGRDGLGGPEDFGLEEGQEDDGEKFGAKEIAKAIRTYGATDVLVIVSRWYGGTMLGPARFRHIEDCAKAALARHMVNEALTDLKTELKELDGKIADLRSQNVSNASNTPSSQLKKNVYDDLDDPEKAQRLIVARKKQIEMLQRPKKSIPTSSSQPSAQEVPLQSLEVNDTSAALDEMDADEEEAALEALREMEKEAETIQALSSQPANETNHTDEICVRIKEEETDNIPLVDTIPHKVKVETTPPSEKDLPIQSVKEEIEEETDLTGWDEL